MNTVWLRNDLRLDDNPALHFACKNAARNNRPVSVIYCTAETQWKEHNEASVKLGFRASALSHLQIALANRGIELHLLRANRFSNCATVIAEFCETHSVKSLWFNSEVPLHEKQRDQQVRNVLNELHIECHSFEHEFLVAPDLLQTQKGGPYKVFTPWYKAWLQQLEAQAEPLPAPIKLSRHTSFTPSNTIELPLAEEFRQDLWPATEAAAHERVQQFCDEKIHRYLDTRDIPSINGTSTLSPYFASGLISSRRCLKIIQDSYREHSIAGSWRLDPWLREIAWREFYRYLMLNFPNLSRGLPFKMDTQYLQWESNANCVTAWQQGKTGYPIIDAAQRQLLRTGWMHNRLRMLTASFYTKLMLEHWSGGEAFFMRHLLDGDFPSNNGGWQWSASTGCDASPWFRVFNPITQSQKFDPDGTFIRLMVPELSSLDSKSIHNPSTQQRQQLNYPAPIVDYRQARERVLERFKRLNEIMSVRP